MLLLVALMWKPVVLVFDPYIVHTFLRPQPDLLFPDLLCRSRVSSMVSRAPCLVKIHVRKSKKLGGFGVSIWWYDYKKKNTITPIKISSVRKIHPNPSQVPLFWDLFAMTTLSPFGNHLCARRWFERWGSTDPMEKSDQFFNTANRNMQELNIYHLACANIDMKTHWFPAENINLQKSGVPDWI